MSAQVYPPQTYRMAPAPPAGQPQRNRHPLNPVYSNTGAGRQYVAQATPPKPVHYEKHPEPKDPPLPRQNSKTLPPSPPKIILDHSGGLQFQRIGFLGEVRGLCAEQVSLADVATGRVRPRLRGQGPPRCALGMQGRHQDLAQDEEGQDEGAPPTLLPASHLAHIHPSFTPRSKSTSPSPIPTSSSSRNASRTPITST